MNDLTFDSLLAACRLGGAGHLTICQRLEPASGRGGIVAPPRYISGSTSTYVFERRYEDGKPVKVVLLDSKPSFSNRLEATIGEAFRRNDSILTRMPHITVDYGDGREYSEFQLPHRAVDGHVRFAVKEDGTPLAKDGTYESARRCTLDDLMPMFRLSPETVAFGCWDSSHKGSQLRIPSIMVGETYGVLVEQDEDPTVHRSGARVDPVAASVKVADKTERQRLIGDGDGLSDKLKTGFLKNGEGSGLILGAIPPQADSSQLDGVAVSDAVSVRTLSFNMLHSFHFGLDEDGDAAVRALTAAIVLRCMAVYDESPVMRANCFLTETGRPSVTLEKRWGEREEFAPLTVESAERLLSDALDNADRVAGVEWNGRGLLVHGNPVIAESLQTDGE